jgi:hypothetical protein
VLKNWPTPKHSDDKTIAVIWRSDAGMSISERDDGS